MSQNYDIKFRKSKPGGVKTKYPTKNIRTIRFPQNKIPTLTNDETRRNPRSKGIYPLNTTLKPTRNEKPNLRRRKRAEDDQQPKKLGNHRMDKFSSDPATKLTFPREAEENGRLRHKGTRLNLPSTNYIEFRNPIHDPDRPGRVQYQPTNNRRTSRQPRNELPILLNDELPRNHRHRGVEPSNTILKPIQDKKPNFRRRKRDEEDDDHRPTKRRSAPSPPIMINDDPDVIDDDGAMEIQEIGNRQGRRERLEQAKRDFAEQVRTRQNQRSATYRRKLRRRLLDERRKTKAIPKNGIRLRSGKQLSQEVPHGQIRRRGRGKAGGRMNPDSI